MKKYEAGGDVEKDENKDSSRTKMIEQHMKEGPLKSVTKGVSRLADKLGFTQESQYAGKTKEEMSQKKAKGGAIKSSNGHSDIKKDKPMMKKVAAEAVKSHEKRMHGAKKMAKGGGVEVKGKTKGRIC